VPVLQQLLDRHLGPLELGWALLGVDELPGDVLHARLGDPPAHLVVVHPGAQRAEEVDGLAREGVDELGHVLLGDAVRAEDALAHADPVLAGGSPVELLHAAVADERRVQRGEVVAGDDDGDTGVLLLVVHPGELHVGGVVGDVHQGGVHHLVVHRVLGGAAHAAGAGVQVVDEEHAHLALADDVGGLAVALADELGGLAGVAALQLAGAHDDGVDAHLGEHQLALERLALALAPPDPQDEGHLDVWQGHEVLGDVDDELVHEGRRDVVAVHGVVEAVVPEALADVLVGGEHGLVGAVPHGRLEEGVDEALAPGDVLLVVGDVVGQALPPVGVGLLRLVHLLLLIGEDSAAQQPPAMATAAPLVHVLLLPDELLLPEEDARRRGLRALIWVSDGSDRSTLSKKKQAISPSTSIMNQLINYIYSLLPALRWRWWRRKQPPPPWIWILVSLINVRRSVAFESS
jgi:hypothetical protein